MTNAFERETPFNPMRFREEIKSLDSSVARLELLIKQYKTCYGLKGHENLAGKIREESAYLKNIWQELECKLNEVEKKEVPYYFIKEQTKRKINYLLENASEVLRERFL